VLSSAVSMASRYAEMGGPCIDSQYCAAGQFDDEIRTQASILGLPILLLDEVAVIEHAGHLDHALELHLAVAAADVGCRSALTRFASRCAATGRWCFDQL